jgi:carboxymethylenebutenolidase
VGFCYGGLMSWLSATRGETVKMQPSCCVGYYAGGIGKVAKEEPSCPVMLHFGAEDSHIGSDQIEAVREAHPEVEIFVYEGAGHAFNRDPDPNSYRADAAKLARERTLEFFATHIA